MTTKQTTKRTTTRTTKRTTVGQLAISAVLLAAANWAHAADTPGLQEKLKVCATCHGENGISATADFPKLAGQHQDYLLRSLMDYKSGARKNPIMAGQVANLSRRDMQELASYYAKQPGLAFKY